MHKKSIVILFVFVGILSLSACSLTIYDLFGNGQASSGLVSDDSDESISSIPQGTTSSTSQGYDKVSTKYSARDLGESVGYNYLHSTGNQKILVIPVEFTNYSSLATSANRSNIATTFGGEASETAWQSVRSFYKTSSYGYLNLEITVSDWYNCGYSTSEVSALNTSDNEAAGVEKVLNSAVSWYKKTYNTNATDFDRDGDGYLDGVWLVYGAPDYSKSKTVDSTFWAFTSWAYNDASLTSPTACSYCWASYDFMYEGYGTNSLDAHTYIHETGHMLGLEDYYSYSTSKKVSPMGGVDMMDDNIIDHNAFSKFCYNWVTPYLIDHTGTLTLEPSEDGGECAIIPTSKGWNGSCFDEYMMIEYYTPTGLNEKDSTSRYDGTYPLGFTESGLRIYHVDARMCQISANGNSYRIGDYTDTITSSSTTGTLLAHSNTSDEGYNYLDNSYRLLQTMDCTGKKNFDEGYYTADNGILFTEGTTFSFSDYRDSFPLTSTMNDGGTLPYSITVTSLSSSSVTLSITAA